MGRRPPRYAVGGRVALSQSRTPALDSRQAIDEALRRATLGREAFVAPGRCAEDLRALARGGFGGANLNDEPLLANVAGAWVVGLCAGIDR